MAQYRCGEYAKAIESLEFSLEKMPVELKLPGPHPANLAFLAMSHLQLGNIEEATKYRNQLTKVMKLDEFKDDEEALGFVEEVNSLCKRKQKAAAEAKPATESEGKDNE